MADQLCLLTTRINGEIDLQYHFNRSCIEILQDLRAEDQDLPLEAVDLAELGDRPEEGPQGAGRPRLAEGQAQALINLVCRAVLIINLFDLF